MGGNQSQAAREPEKQESGSNLKQENKDETAARPANYVDKGTQTEISGEEAVDVEMARLSHHPRIAFLNSWDGTNDGPEVKYVTYSLTLPKKPSYPGPVPDLRDYPGPPRRQWERWTPK